MINFQMVLKYQKDLTKLVRFFCSSKDESVNPYMLVVANFGQYKRMQKTWKMTETLAYGYTFERTQWELSDEYQHSRF